MRYDNKADSRVHRRTYLKAASGVGAAGLFAGCVGSFGGSSDGNGGSDFPTEDITLVIPYGTGGGYNAYTRLVAEYMQKELPVSVKPKNVEGASGRVATNQVFNADADGYTNQIVNLQSFVRQQIIRDVRYDLTKMTYYPQVAANKRAIGVGTNTDIKTWDDYLTAVENESIKFTATGPASGGSVVPFATGEVSGLYSADKVLNNLVTFDGKGGSIKAIKSGDAHVMAGSYSSILPFVESGDLRVVMVASMDDKPPKGSPDAATFKTANVNKGQQIADMLTTRRVFAGPPDVPEERANVLRKAFTTAIKSDDLKADAKEIDRPIVYADSEKAKEAMQNSFDRWNQLSGLLKEISGE